MSGWFLLEVDQIASDSFFYLFSSSVLVSGRRADKLLLKVLRNLIFPLLTLFFFNGLFVILMIEPSQ